MSHQTPKYGFLYLLPPGLLFCLLDPQPLRLASLLPVLMFGFLGVYLFWMVLVLQRQQLAGVVVLVPMIGVLLGTCLVQLSKYLPVGETVSSIGLGLGGLGFVGMILLGMIGLVLDLSGLLRQTPQQHTDGEPPCGG